MSPFLRQIEAVVHRLSYHGDDRETQSNSSASFIYRWRKREREGEEERERERTTATNKKSLSTFSLFSSLSSLLSLLLVDSGAHSALCLGLQRTRKGELMRAVVCHAAIRHRHGLREADWLIAAPLSIPPLPLAGSTCTKMCVCVCLCVCLCLCVYVSVSVSVCMCG